MLASACTCGEGSFDVPEAPPVEAPAPEGPRDPRVPPSFDLSFPEGAIVRYGESDEERATVLVTLDAEPAEVLRFAREQLEGRGWTVHARGREGASPVGRFREAIEARDGERSVASAIVERGAAPITRLHLSRKLEGGARFHAPEEPRAWRTVRRAPMPGIPGLSELACNAAMTRLCRAYAEAGGPDALDCALDHRAACGRIEHPEAALGFANDARARLEEALVAHAVVGSRGARAETLAQLHVELLYARASLVRAAAAGADASALADLVAATEAEGVTLDVDTTGWFAPAPAEIPGGEAP